MEPIALVIFYCVTGGNCGVTVAASFPQHAQCMAQSQIVAAQWHGNHPKVEVKNMKITCMSRRELDAVLGKHEA